ncbi:MAG: RHS repeat-associated core domain-containing protein [Pseudomonadota bacterium]
MTLSDDANGPVIADAIYIVPQDTTNAPFTWTATLPSADIYDVYARWPADGGRATAATYSIAHELGTSDVTVNQRANGDQWVLLGTYDFDPAIDDAEVTLDGFSDGTVAADAIRFVEAGVAPTEVSYLHNDQLGRPQKMTDSTGLITSDRTQRPFGETVTDSGLDSTPIRFPGQYADAETGLSYNYFRDYDPSLGRYVTSDPIGLRGGNNTYGYVGGNPLNRFDPDGQIAIPIIIPPIIIGGYIICRLSGNCETPSGLDFGDFGFGDESDDCEDDDGCEKMYDIDTSTCNGISRIRGKAFGAKCHASAAERYSACLAGRPIPPLNTWNN